MIENQIEIIKKFFFDKFKNNDYNKNKYENDIISVMNKQITWEEQKAVNEFNTVFPYKTSTTINFDGSINTGVAAERVAYDSSVSLGTPTGAIKAKFDAIDERTIHGCNWDNIDVQKVLGNK